MKRNTDSTERSHASSSAMPRMPKRGELPFAEKLMAIEREASLRLESNFQRHHERDRLIQWQTSDILDSGKWGVLNMNNKLVFGVGWHLTREQCDALVERHNHNDVQSSGASALQSPTTGGRTP